jgi:hypothetical protein
MCDCIYCHCKDEKNDYRECVLLDNQIICDICCNYQIGSNNSVVMIKRLINKNITLDEIKAICRKCGKSIEFL